MLTSLDYLIIVFLGLALVTFLSLCLMFLLKNKLAKRVFLYIVLATGLFLSYIGLYMGLTGCFTEQIVLGIVTVPLIVGALVLDVISRDDAKKQRIARIAGALALVLAMANVFFI